MKYLLATLTLITLVISGYGQRNVLDSAFVIKYCESDTSVRFYPNSEIGWVDSSRSEYEFLPGDKTYLEISIRKKCNSTHSTSNEIILVELTASDTSCVIPISPENTTWLLRASWRYDPFETGFSGTLDFKNHSLEFYPGFDAERNVLLSGEIFNHPLIVWF